MAQTLPEPVKAKTALVLKNAIASKPAKAKTALVPKSATTPKPADTIECFPAIKSATSEFLYWNKLIHDELHKNDIKKEDKKEVKPAKPTKPVKKPRKLTPKEREHHEILFDIHHDYVEDYIKNARLSEAEKQSLMTFKSFRKNLPLPKPGNLPLNDFTGPDKKYKIPRPSFMIKRVFSNPESYRFEARFCGHRVHNGTADLDGFKCPGCWVMKFMRPLQGIAETWDYAGGPMNRGNDIRSLYRETKIKLVTVIYALEAWAACEEEWERNNAEEAKEMKESKGRFRCVSAAEGLDMAWKQMPYYTHIEDKFVPDYQLYKHSRLSGRTEIVKKSVKWVDGIEEHPRRIQHKYIRQSWFYSPGRHACPDPEGWENTSHCFDAEFQWECEEFKWDFFKTDKPPKTEEALEEDSDSSDESSSDEEDELEDVPLTDVPAMEPKTMEELEAEVDAEFALEDRMVEQGGK